MKHSQLFAGVLAMILSSFVFSACNKDSIPPVITLLGDDPMEIALYSPYSEPGATAEDDVDGELTDMIDITGTVNSDILGDYTITYTVADERGNTTSIDRTVSVVIMRENYTGSWAVAQGSDCPFTWTSGTTQNIAAGSSVNEIVFNDFYGGLGGSLTANISGQNLTIPSQNPLSLGEVAGTGVINNTAGEIILSLTRSTLLGDETCTLTYAK